jgi:hypothetical protein
MDANLLQSIISIIHIGCLGIALYKSLKRNQGINILSLYFAITIPEVYIIYSLAVN